MCVPQVGCWEGQRVSCFGTGGLAGGAYDWEREGVRYFRRGLVTLLTRRSSAERWPDGLQGETASLSHFKWASPQHDGRRRCSKQIHERGATSPATLSGIRGGCIILPLGRYTHSTARRPGQKKRERLGLASGVFAYNIQQGGDCAYEPWHLLSAYLCSKVVTY